jgi:hypothetical protein
MNLVEGNFRIGGVNFDLSALSQGQAQLFINSTQKFYSSETGKKVFESNNKLFHDMTVKVGNDPRSAFNLFGNDQEFNKNDGRYFNNKYGDVYGTVSEIKIDFDNVHKNVIVAKDFDKKGNIVYRTVLVNTEYMIFDELTHISGIKNGSRDNQVKEFMPVLDEFLADKQSVVQTSYNDLQLDVTNKIRQEIGEKILQFFHKSGLNDPNLILSPYAIKDLEALNDPKQSLFATGVRQNFLQNIDPITAASILEAANKNGTNLDIGLVLQLDTRNNRLIWPANRGFEALALF